MERQEMERSGFGLTNPGIAGLDELAAELGVEEAGGSGIELKGKSGKHYDLVAILAAHLREMRERSITK
jgi:hypothetical protein